MDALLAELDGAGFVVSVDTSRAAVLEVCLGHDVHMLNDIGGLADPVLAARAGEAGLAACGMASFSSPGDACGVEATLEALDLVAARAAAAGIDRLVLDPGVGLWTADRTVEDDWALCCAFDRFTRLDHPVLAAVSRKTFLGALTGRGPGGAPRRLARRHGIAAREGGAPRPDARRPRDCGPAPGAGPAGGLPVTTAFAIHALGTPILVPGDDLAGALLDAVALTEAGAFRDGDVVVVAETAVATVEGSVIPLDEVAPSVEADDARPPVCPRPPGRPGGPRGVGPGRRRHRRLPALPQERDAPAERGGRRLERPAGACHAPAEGPGRLRRAAQGRPRAARRRPPRRHHRRLTDPRDAPGMRGRRDRLRGDPGRDRRTGADRPLRPGAPGDQARGGRQHRLGRGGS